MTITSTTSRWEAVGNGSTTVFPYNNKIFADTDLKVYLNGVLQTLTTHYTVSGAGTDSGGNVTFVTAPATSASVVIVRDVANTQEIDYPPGGAFPANSTEDGLDRRTIISQQNVGKLGRAIQYLESDAGLPSPILPTLGSLKGKYLRFNSATGAPEAALLDASALSGGAATAYPITGDGSTVAFAIGEAPNSENHVYIYLSGAWQERSTYSVSGSTITFSEAPPDGVTGDILVMRALSLSASADASSIAYQPSGAGAVETTVQATLRNYMPTLEDFGGGTAVADNAAAFQAAMDAGGRLYIPSGNRYPIKSAITRTGFLQLVGGGSLVWTSDATSTGLTVTLTTADNYSDRVSIGNVQFRTQKVGEGTALTIDGTAQISGGVLQKRNFGRVFLNDTAFRGDTAPGVDGWLNNIDLQGVSNVELKGVYFTGVQNGSEASITTETAIKCDDQGNGAVLNLHQVSIYTCQIGVDYDGVEGVNVHQCNIVAVNTGVKAVNTNTGLAPWVAVQNSHINARVRAIDLSEMQGIIIKDNFIWQRQSATAIGTGVYISDCDDVDIEGNQFVGDYVNTSGVTYYGVLLVGTTSDARVRGNHGQDVSLLAWAQVGVDDVLFSDNHVSKEAVAAPAPGLYANTSSGRVIIDTERFSGKSGSDVTDASGTLVDVDMGTVHLGQAFMVTAKVLYTKGATAGLTSTEVLKGAGTATVVFVHDASTLDFEVEQDATDANTHTVTGPMVVTAAGTLTLRCQFTSAGSDATILTGNAQLSAIQLGTSGRLS